LGAKYGEEFGRRMIPTVKGQFKLPGVLRLPVGFGMRSPHSAQDDMGIQDDMSILLPLVRHTDDTETAAILRRAMEHFYRHCRNFPEW
jgi:hypothetical protein